MFWPEQVIISDDNKIEKLTELNEPESSSEDEKQGKSIIDKVKSSLGIKKSKSSVSLKRVFYDSRMNIFGSKIFSIEKENPERDRLLDSQPDRSEFPTFLIDKGTDLNIPALDDLKKPVSVPRLSNKSNPKIDPDRLKFPESYRNDITKPVAYNRDKGCKDKESSDAMNSLIQSHKIALCTVKYIATDVICTVASTVMDVLEDPKTREATKQLACALFFIIQRKTMEILNLDKKDPCRARKQACAELQKACEEIKKSKAEFECSPSPPKEKSSDPLIIIKSKLKHAEEKKKNVAMNHFRSPCCTDEDPCINPDPCPKPDPCAEPDPCPKPDPCDPCAKPKPCDPCAKPNPCDPCAKPKPCDPCAIPKPCDPCNLGAKPDPCDSCAKVDPCDPCSHCLKPDPCERIAHKKNAPLEIPNPCLKIPDPWQKTEPEPEKVKKPSPKRQPQTQKSN